MAGEAHHLGEDAPLPLVTLPKPQALRTRRRPHRRIFQNTRRYQIPTKLRQLALVLVQANSQVPVSAVAEKPFPAEANQLCDRFLCSRSPSRKNRER